MKFRLKHQIHDLLSAKGRDAAVVETLKNRIDEFYDKSVASLRIHDGDCGGCLFVGRRANAENGRGGLERAATRSRTAVRPEVALTRALFNGRKEPLSGGWKIIAYEAPLLRRKEGNSEEKVWADLVALSDELQPSKVLILENKVPKGDGLDHALLQAWLYAYIVYLHLHHKSKDGGVDFKYELTRCCKRYLGTDVSPAQELRVRYAVLAPRDYYEGLSDELLVRAQRIWDELEKHTDEVKPEGFWRGTRDGQGGCLTYDGVSDGRCKPILARGVTFAHVADFDALWEGPMGISGERPSGNAIK